MGPAPARRRPDRYHRRALKRLKASEEWGPDRRIPYASTFLRGERWHDADELPEPHGNGSGQEVFGWQT